MTTSKSTRWSSQKLQQRLWTLLGATLVATQAWWSVSVSSSLLQPQQINNIDAFPPNGDAARRRDNTALSQKPTLTVDILSIGSNHRPEYLEAQRETFANHASVRYFVGVTQEDSQEPECEKQISTADVQAIVKFCKVSWEDANKHPAYTSGSVSQRLRARFAGWDNFLKHHRNPEGWLCSQRRPVDALWRLLQYYSSAQDGNSTLPDYLFLTDDDTYYNMPAVLHYLHTLYNSETPIVMAGCLIRFMYKFPEYMAIPYGGWGTILSKAALQNLLRPIDDCDGNAIQKNEKRNDDFLANSCHRLRQNLLHEKSYMKPNISVAQLMYAIPQQNLYRDFRGWNDTHNFCMHSDWMTGYFSQYYNVGTHTGDPALWNITEARMTSYRRSVQIANKRGVDVKKRLAMEGQCRFRNESCTVDSHICHYMSPAQMHNMIRQQHEFQTANIQVAMTTKAPRMIQNPDWKAMWVRRRPNRNDSTLNVAQQPSFPSSKPKSDFIPNNTTKTPVSVFVYPFMNHTIAHELKHYLWDGLHHSSRLEWTTEFNTTAIWMIDAHRAGLRASLYCTRLVKLLSEALTYKQEHTGMLDQWKIVLFYWEDEPMDDFLNCFRAVRLVDSLRVYRYKRSMVVDRHWDPNKRFIVPGRMLEYGNWREHSAAPVQRIHYGVRSDIVRGLLQLLGYRDATTLDPLPLADTLARVTPRPIDVTCFWPRKGQDDQRVTRGKGSQLRDEVSETLYALSSSHRTDKEYNIFVGLTGEADEAGRNQVQEAYLQKLLTSKIVVVAQKDRWEDHYRLFEALSSGSLVMTDPMLSLPMGLEDGQSIIVYKDLADLLSQIEYFLQNENERQQIASEGFRVAMTRHRSWHMMEKIVFDDLDRRNDYQVL